jgi:hypothetical protein
MKLGTEVHHDVTTNGVRSTVHRSIHKYVIRQKLTPPGSILKEQILPKNIASAAAATAATTITITTTSDN